MPVQSISAGTPAITRNSPTNILVATVEPCTITLTGSLLGGAPRAMNNA